MQKLVVTIAVVWALVPRQAGAEDKCRSAAQELRKIWERYEHDAKEAGCLAPVKGPRKLLACAIDGPMAPFKLADKLTGWWNSLAEASGNESLTLGPRMLANGAETGKIVAGYKRTFISVAALNVEKATLHVDKLGGGANGEITICTTRQGGDPRAVGQPFVVKENAPLRHDLDVRDGILSVVVDSKGVGDFKYQIQVKTTPYKWSYGGIHGFADTHVHQTSELGFGGNWLRGSHTGPASKAFPACNSLPSGTGFTEADLKKAIAGGLEGLHAIPFDSGGVKGASDGEIRHGHGSPDFAQWPHHNDIAHQQVHADQLKKAHDGGLQLAVVTAVNTEVLCHFLKALYPRPNDKLGCDDMENVKRQLDAAARFADEHDWYEIALTPWHARRIIHEGKLAVVLSAEASNLFPPGENGYQFQLQDLYAERGLRMLQPAHEADNRFVGAAHHRNATTILPDLYSTGKLPGSVSAVQLYRDLQRLVQLFKASVDPKFRLGPQEGGGGMTALGKQLFQTAMSLHMMIDLSHSSPQTHRDYFKWVTAADTPKSYRYYPMIQSHARFDAIKDPAAADSLGNFVTTDEQIDMIKRLGGLIGVRTAPDRVQTVDGENDCHGSAKSVGQSLKYGYQKGVTMALGSDINGSTNQVGPRFGRDKCPANTAKDWPGFDEGKIPSSPASDYWNRGLAHIGLEPDLVQDLARYGGRGGALLANSAEAFLQSWERTWDTNRKLLP